MSKSQQNEYSPDDIRAQNRAIDSFGGIEAIQARMRWFISAGLYEYGIEKIPEFAREFSKRARIEVSAMDLIDYASGNKAMSFSLYNKLCQALEIQSDHAVTIIEESDDVENVKKAGPFLRAIDGLERRLG